MVQKKTPHRAFGGRKAPVQISRLNYSLLRHTVSTEDIVCHVIIERYQRLFFGLKHQSEVFISSLASPLERWLTKNIVKKKTRTKSLEYEPKPLVQSPLTSEKYKKKIEKNNMNP